MPIEIPSTYAPKTFIGRVRELRDLGFTRDDKKLVNYNGVRYTCIFCEKNQSKILSGFKALICKIVLFIANWFDMYPGIITELNKDYQENMKAMKCGKISYHILSDKSEDQLVTAKLLFYNPTTGITRMSETFYETLTDY